MKKTIQLHHQFKDKDTRLYGNHTEMVGQQEINMESRYIEMMKFIDDTRKSNPLPEDAQWIVVEEGSEFFVKQEDKEKE